MSQAVHTSSCIALALRASTVTVSCLAPSHQYSPQPGTHPRVITHTPHMQDHPSQRLLISQCSATSSLQVRLHGLTRADQTSFLPTLPILVPWAAPHHHFSAPGGVPCDGTLTVGCLRPRLTGHCSGLSPSGASGNSVQSVNK